MKKKHLRVLREISENIPRELLDTLIRKEDAFPTLREVLERGLEDPDVSPEDKTRFRAIMGSGVLDRTVEVLDESTESLIDAYFTAEIERAIQEGRLPKKAPMLKLKNNKGKQYARRQARRLESLFSAGSEAVADAPQADEEEQGSNHAFDADARVAEAQDGGDSGRGGEEEVRAKNRADEDLESGQR